jgi:hypothetical protein
VTAQATLNPAPSTCTSRRIGIVRCVLDGKKGWVGSGGGAQIREEEEVRGRGGWIFIRPGAFQTMEHLLATPVVYQHHRGDAYSFFQGHSEQWSTCWKRGLGTRIAFVGRACKDYLFYVGF